MNLDRYRMTKEENIFSAKRIMVDSVYQQANLEGIGVTFAETQDILNNVNINTLTPNEISKVCCLRDGWKYLIENIDRPLDLAFLETLHEIIARFDVEYKYLGVLRYEEVMISGTKWRPEIPDIEKLHSDLLTLMQTENKTERALRIGLYIMRSHPFKDGNKRVGSFAANKILITEGCGIFNVPVKLDGAFKQRLVDYYESNDCEEFLEWIADHCLDGTNQINISIR